MAGMIAMMKVDGIPDVDYAELFRRLEEREREEINLTPYFTTEELNDMCDLEKRRFWNMKINYELMNEFGVPLGRPEFMDNKKKKAKQKPVDYSSSDSDEEWTPQKAREKERQEEMMIERRRGRKEKFQFPPIKKVKVDIAKAKREGHERAVAARKRKQKAKSSRSRRLCSVEELFQEDDLEEFFGFSQDEIHQSEKRCSRIQKRNKSLFKGGDSSRSTRIAKTQEKPAQDASSRSTRYPRRNIPKTDYAKIEVPDDDCFLYCEECNVEHLGDCPVHGPLIVIEDSKTEPDDKLRADHSCPEGLVIKQSKIPGAGSGVWSTKGFPKGVRFGPYMGEVNHSVDEVHSSGYGWQIFKNDKGRHYIDAKEVSASNWMRYVNCARHDSEQNLLAFQYLGNIYYKTIMPVKSCEELLVWYGDAYAKELGISKLPSEGPVTDFQKDDRKPTIYQLLKNPDIKGYECEHCGRLFSIEEYLLVHKWTWHGVRLGMDYFCNVCGSRFPTNFRLQEHCSRSHKAKLSETIKNNEETFPAANKEKVNLRLPNGRLNIPLEEPLTAENDAAGRHVCCICRKLFRSGSTLAVHMRIHSGEKPYTCNVCGKGFTQQGALTQHMRIHTGERNYTCNVCGKGFAKQFNLSRHMRLHSGDKPYSCSICGKGFAQQPNLTTHMRTHSGEKPYTCNVCGKGFACGKNLKDHIRIHTGERPYTCNVCGKGFSRQSNLNTHMRLHSGEKPYTCNICGKGFSNTSNLKSHSRTNHVEQ